MTHFLDEDFDPRYLEGIASVRGEDYYVRMMVAWYFATALAKQWKDTLPYLESGRLEDEVRAIAVRKAVESRRLTPEQKETLRRLG